MSRESTVNNLQHKWFATFGHCLLCIEWLLEEPFCVGEVSLKFDFLRLKMRENLTALVEIFCIIICFLVKWIAVVIIFCVAIVIVIISCKIFGNNFFKVLVILNVCVDVCDNDHAWLACWNFVSLLEVVQVIVFAVAIWPLTGQGFQNTKWPAVLYSQ